MPVSVVLKGRKPELAAIEGDSLGAHLRRRRRELGLRRIDAAALLDADEKSLMWWERDVRLPFISAYPAIIAFLGYEPWPEPRSLGDALLAERRRRGFEIRRAANLIGVDEGTWRRWERGEWRPTQNDMTKHSSLPGHRKRWALHQRELAHLVGVARSIVSRYESGALTPSVRGVLALEVIFGESGRDLFPTAYAEIEEKVMRRAAKLDRTLALRSDKASKRKRQLFSEMARRGAAPRRP